MKLSERLKPLMLAIFILLLALWPRTGINAARQGLYIWANALIPSLFPYCFLSTALQRGGMERWAGRHSRKLMHVFGCPEGGIGTVICGWLSGGPTGAKLTGIYAETHSGSRLEYLRLAWLSSACSPAFALGTLEAVLPDSGWPILISNWAGILINGLIMRRVTALCHGDIPSFDEGAVKGAACRNSPALEAALTMLMVGGWVIIFSVLSAYMYLITFSISPAAPALPLAALHALLEMAGGGLTLAEIPFRGRLPVIAFMMTFGGLSIGLQALSLLKPLGIPAHAYFAGKLIQGAAAAAVCALIVNSGADMALAGAHEVSQKVYNAPAAAIALLLAVIAAILNGRYIAWDKANRPVKQ